MSEPEQYTVFLMNKAFTVEKERMFMKKLLAMILIGCMALGVAACGGGSDSGKSDKVWVVGTDTVFRPF